MPDLGPILASLVSMDLDSFRGFDERERFKAFRLRLRPSRRLILSFHPYSYNLARKRIVSQEFLP